jgi:hypothetical protein
MMDCSLQFQSGGPVEGDQQFGGLGFGGGFRRGIDEDTLKEIAAMTDGSYYSAESAGELLNVFQDLPAYLISRQEIMDISVMSTAIGALLATLAITLSLIWHPLP